MCQAFRDAEMVAHLGRAQALRMLLKQGHDTPAHVHRDHRYHFSLLIQPLVRGLAWCL